MAVRSTSVGKAPGGTLTVPTTTRGYERLLRWAEGFGPVGCAGIEGTAASYGAGLARHLKTAGISVVEVERPKRRHRRRNGKSDPIDAEAAARAVLAGEAVGEPKSGDGRVEMIRTFRAARHSAVEARSQAANQLQALLVTAPPEELRHRLRELPTKELVATCARLRPGDDPDDVRTRSYGDRDRRGSIRSFKYYGELEARGQEMSRWRDMARPLNATNGALRAPPTPAP